VTVENRLKTAYTITCANARALMRAHTYIAGYPFFKKSNPRKPIYLWRIKFCRKNKII